MKLPAWPSHVEKNDDFVFIGNGQYDSIPHLKGVLAVGLFNKEKVIQLAEANREWGGGGFMNYFVKKGDPFLARFAPQMPTYLPPLPEGTVYIGKGGLECHPTWEYGKVIVNMDFYYYDPSCGWDFFSQCWSSGGDIAAKIDSPLHKAQPWYVPNTKAKPAIKAENKPKITPLPAHIKVPEGHVYCGKGNEVKVPSNFNCWNCPCRYDDGIGWYDGGNVFAQSKSLYYFFPIGSEIAILNGHTVKKRRETLKEKDARIESLNKEIAALKDKVAEYEGWIKTAPKV